MIVAPILLLCLQREMDPHFVDIEQGGILEAILHNQLKALPYPLATVTSFRLDFPTKIQRMLTLPKFSCIL
jgi:hypothetical protein